jgi:BASS family bile acid:Na+ symporter
MIEEFDKRFSSLLIFLIPLAFVVGYMCKGFLPPYKGSATPALFMIMFCSTFGLRFSDFIELGENGPPIVLGIMLQLLALPLIAYAVAHTFYSTTEEAQLIIGHLCVSTAPAAISTIIWSRITGGNIALAVMVVGIHVLLVPFTAPLTLKLLVGGGHVPMLALSIRLFIAVLLPTLTAVSLYRHLNPERVKPLFASIAKLGMLYMIVLNTSVAASTTPISWEVARVMGIMAIQVSLFYSVGFLAGKLCRFSPQSRLTLTYFLGMKNNGAALVMALAGFSAKSSLPVAIAIACQQPIASVIDRFWRKLHQHD